MKKFLLSLFLFTSCCLGITSQVFANSENHSSIYGGWTEENGYFTNQQTSARSIPNHMGYTETRVVSGTTQKRAVGNTNWAGVYHYTRAVVKGYELGIGRLITDSGRVWGTSITSATSPWASYNQFESLRGETYYGQ